MRDIIFYNGFDIIYKDGKYHIIGSPYSFFTLAETKRHIDFMKLDKSATIYQFPQTQ